MRIVYMGTPDFAVPALRLLAESGRQVVAVVTAPDKPAGRGQKITETPVKSAARALEIPVLQPEKLRAPEFLSALAELKPDLQIVVAFRMLPEVVWALPPLGTVNLHASLLPAYRGAAPINWAIINGETQTGLTTFFIEKEIDTGKIIFQEFIPISPKTTAGELHDEMSVRGAELMLKTVAAIEAGNAPSVAQPLLIDAPRAPKIFPDDCKINWNLSVKRVFDFIRGLSPYPGAWTRADGEILKVYFAEIETDAQAPPFVPGTIRILDKRKITVDCLDGRLSLTDVQLAGRKRMNAQAFLNGLKTFPLRLE